MELSKGEFFSVVWEDNPPDDKSNMKELTVPSVTLLSLLSMHVCFLICPSVTMRGKQESLQFYLFGK